MSLLFILHYPASSQYNQITLNKLLRPDNQIRKLDYTLMSDEVTFINFFELKKNLAIFL